MVVIIAFPLSFKPNIAPRFALVYNLAIYLMQVGRTFDMNMSIHPR
jgi:hypothetical protein